MRQISKNKRQTTAAVSVVLVLVGIFMFAIFNPNALTLYANEIFLLGILVVIIPSAVLDYENQTWVSAIEDQMPLLVRGVSESQETGLTLVKASRKSSG